MKKAARAIIFNKGKILVMHRNKYGSEYFTLVGGRLGDNESLEQALAREVKEETGLDITNSRLVFVEDHVEPYNKQYIFLCEVAPFESVNIQDSSEESFLNRLNANIHKPVWCDPAGFARLQFRTPQLHQAILLALTNGFPKEPQTLKDEPQTQIKKSISGRIRRHLPF